MSYKCCLSYGHGANTYEDARSKYVVNGGKVYEEHTHNASVGAKVKTILQAHGVTILEVQPPFGSDVPLKTRTDKANAWGADLYYSIHANAAASSVRGYTAFYWNGSAKGKQIAEIYAKHIKELGWPLYHNGVYPSVEGTWNDFHELRETHMIAVLTENGFMTNAEDFKRIFLNENDAWDKEARAHAKTILEYFGMKYDPVKGGETVKPSTPIAAPVAPKPAPSGTIFRVQAGAFKDEDGAKARVAALKKAGFEAYYTSN